MTTEAAYQEIPLKDVHESPLNPRKTFDPAKLASLTASVRVKGVITPLIVRPNAKGFEIAAGHRRYRAAKAAELETVPAVVRKMDDETFLETLVFENDEREDLHPLEEADGYKTLMTKSGFSAARIAERTGYSEKYVYDRIKLLNLIPEAQKLFRERRFEAGHAILLARLSPEDQKRIVVPDKDSYDGESVLLKADALLLAPDDERKLGKGAWPTKPISVRELEEWIAKHVRFNAAKADPFLFPEAAATAAPAPDQKRAKIVEITHLSFVQPEAREGAARTIREGYWQRADGKKGSKPCDRAVTGVIVVGPEQGSAFKVCVDRERCLVHWKKEIEAKKKAAKSTATSSGSAARKSSAQTSWKREEERRKREEAAREDERARWKKATPKILEAIAVAVKKAPTKATGLLASIVVEAVKDYGTPRGAADYVPVGKTADDVVRHAAFIVLQTECAQWRAPEQFQKRAKAFGLDVKKIVDEVAPAAKAEPAAKSKK